MWMVNLILIGILLSGMHLDINAQRLYYNAFDNVQRAGAHFVPSFADPLHCVYNPALIPDSINFATAFFVEKKYMLAGLMSAQLGISKRIRTDAVTFGYSRFTGGDLHEQTLSLGFAKNLGKVNAGFKIGFFSARTAHLRLLSGINTSVAAIIRLSGSAYSSIRLVNVHAAFGRKDSATIRPASEYAIGCGFFLSNNVYLGAENIKAEDRSQNLAVLIAWEISEKLMLRSSWRSHSSQPFIAITWRRDKWSLETGLSYHVVLGPSPTCVLIFRSTR